MEKIAKEDMPKRLPVKYGKSSQLRTMLMELEVGEGLFMPKQEWKSRDTPAYIIALLKKTKKLRFEYGLKTDGSGWLFKRIA